MSLQAIRFNHCKRPLDAKAWEYFYHSGKLFSGAPPLSHVIRLELLHAIAACIGRHLFLSELKQLFRVEKFERELVGGRKIRMIEYAIIPKHLQKLLTSASGVSKALARADVMWGQVPLPVGGFSEARLHENVMRFKKGANNHKTRAFPQRRDHRKTANISQLTRSQSRSQVNATLRRVTGRQLRGKN